MLFGIMYDHDTKSENKDFGSRIGNQIMLINKYNYKINV